MEICSMKNNIQVVIREPQEEDAQSMIDFYNLVGGETHFLSFDKDGFQMSLDAYKSFMESTKAEDNSAILIATVDNKIISIATINSTQKPKGKHVGSFGIVVKKEYCGLGIGSKLMDILINWAKSNGITKKITLVTNEDNNTAINLYKKFGFEIEGTLKKETYINEKYYDLIYMGLIL